MAYIGVQPTDTYLSIASQQITGNGGANYTLDYSVSDEESLAVFVNNVRQNVSSYTVSGTSLTLGGTISASDECWVLFLGRTVGTKTPAVGSVTNDMLAGSIANAKLANSSITLNGSAVSLGGSTTISEGITNAQLWRVTADQTGDQTPLSGVFEQPDTDGQGYIGSIMSESSGIWTFPTTGVWLVRFTAMFENTTRNDRLINVIILTTTNGSSYDNASFSYTGIEQSTYATGVSSILFDVTNTSTHKVKFHTENVDSATRTLGNTGVNQTHITFVRLGDT
jgi:hypothetical protein